MRFVTPDEKHLLDTLPTVERAVVQDFFDVLDARLAAFEPRHVTVGDRGADAGVATRAAQEASPAVDAQVGAAPVPLFHLPEEDAA